MDASFNGARRNLARAYNALANGRYPEDSHEQALWGDLRAGIAGLLCMYDPDCDGDSDDLSDECKWLREVKEAQQPAGEGG